MAQVAEIAWNVDGDIGGIGVSRFRFCRQDSADFTGADIEAAANATQNVLGAATAYTPSGITWTCNPEVNVYDAATGLVAPPWVITAVPSPITGLGSGGHGAGLGARINWKTDTISNRRLIKGATYIVPLASAAFDSGGGVAAAVQTGLNTGTTAYLAAMAAASLNAMIWHRPKKGTTSGGITGVVIVGRCSPTPAGLRSRRS